MFTISRTYTFSAAHRIEGHPKCGRLHGHNYKVTVDLSGEILPEDGMLLDFGALDKICKPYFDETYDHRYLVSKQNIRTFDPYFIQGSRQRPQDICVLDCETSTAEELAKQIFDHLSSSLNSTRLQVSRVAVEETERNTAYYDKR